MSHFPKKRQGDYTHISDILSGIVKNIRKESASDLTRIQEIWNSIIDPAIREYTRPEALKNDILLVRLASSTLTHKLRFMVPEIIEKINLAYGNERIAEIRFKIGNV